jgi:predicted amidophosphoribosyltransferase
LYFDRALSIGNYQALLQQQVLKMKGLRNEPLAWQLGRLLAAKHQCLLEIESGWPPIDIVTHIPIHWLKRLQRGFNASQLIAEGFCSVGDYPLLGNVLKYQRLTSKQGLLSTVERFRNVAGAFAVNPRIELADRHVLVIDDVMTSGATLAVAAQAIKARGARTVTVAVVARGTRHQ